MDTAAGGKMQALSASTIRLLGSTQVITSVFSVVKELVENSLDAGSTSVEIKLEDYGLGKIEVRDNGKGIQSSDIPVFAKRHFTSKISSHTDLETLESYGFRGEALASLCAVSEVSVTTKTSGEDVSQTYSLNAEGEVMSSVPSHLGQGTTVCAKSLFKNLPVRKQYHSSVKKKKEDLKNVENLLLAYAVILPNVRLSLRHNKEVVWQKVVLDSTASVLQSIHGKSVMNQMEWKRKSLDDPEMKLELCVPKPGSDVTCLSRSTPDRSFLCVNCRPVIVKEIDKLIRQYYSNCHACEVSRHPVYYLGITLPSRDLDVNLTPNKTSVMATTMPSVLEQLEEMLLYIYGPLDQAPSWRYRDENNSKNTSNEAPSTSSNVLEYLRKTAKDQGDQADDGIENNNTLKKISAEGSSSLVLKPHSLESHTEEENMQQGEKKTENDKLIDTQNMDISCNGEKSGKTVLSEEFRIDKVEQERNRLPCSDNDKFLQDQPCTSTSRANGADNLSKQTVPVSDVSQMTAGNSTPTSKQPQSMDKSSDVSEKKAGEEDRIAEEKGAEQRAGPSGWSHGTSIQSKDGTLVQPVRLLAPSPAQIPGKRPISPPAEGTPPEKRGRKLSPAKSTLYDTINNIAVRRPMSSRDFFFKDKRSSVVEDHPEADYEEVTDILSTMWDDLSAESRIAFREKCWYDTQRYDKEVAAAKREAKNVTGKLKASASVSGKAKQISVRDMVAACSTQPSPRRSDKRASIAPVLITSLPFTMDLLKHSLRLTQPTSLVHFESTQVLGCLQSSQAWVCGRGCELSFLNVHRLSEAIVFQRLLNQHRLAVHHCQALRLSASNTGGMWSVLEKLASPLSLDTFSHLTDCRLTHNGLDVKCWKDGDGDMCGELVGVCGDVPTYGIKDLVEVLTVINDDPSASLARCRPLKVINYLKGEAVRMVRQQAGDRSKEDVEELLEEAASFLPDTADSCLHDRPFFHSLLADVNSAVSSQEQEEAEMPEDLERTEKSEQSPEFAFDQVMSLDDFMDSD